MQETLEHYVATVHASALVALSLTHVKYFQDTKSFGNEYDTYRNDHMIVDFVRARGEDFVQLIPIQHQDDRFDLQYLLAMIEPSLAPRTTAELLATLNTVASKVYVMFSAEQYLCYRRAYNSFENCKNFWPIRRGS
jgi:hypothetical protein